MSCATCEYARRCLYVGLLRKRSSATSHMPATSCRCSPPRRSSSSGDPRCTAGPAKDRRRPSFIMEQSNGAFITRRGPNPLSAAAISGRGPPSIIECRASSCPSLRAVRPSVRLCSALATAASPSAAFLRPFPSVPSLFLERRKEAHLSALRPVCSPGISGDPTKSADSPTCQQRRRAYYSGGVLCQRRPASVKGAGRGDASHAGLVGGARFLSPRLFFAPFRLRAHCLSSPAF